MDETPYTYLIGWPELDRWYYGVRYAKNCHPDDLWNPYKTSSNSVKEFIIQHGPPTIKIIRKIFQSVEKARLWETIVLRRMHVVKSDLWLNKTDNKSIAPRRGCDHPNYGKFGKDHPSFGIKKPEWAELKRTEWTGNQNPSKNADSLAHSIANRSGENHWTHKHPEKIKNKGKSNWVHIQEGALATRQAQFREMNKNRIGTHYRRVDCEYCGNDYSIVTIKQHRRCCKKHFAVTVENTD